MKYFLLTILLWTASNAIAQDKLIFNTKFTQSEDKWVAFEADSIGSHSFGFIYIDSEAGLTLDYAGSFTIQEDGTYLLKKKETESSIKYRLEPNNVLVAIIPESHFEELEISKFPEWLKFYKEDENTVQRLYKWGYRYNEWGECAIASDYLERAKKIDPNYKGIRVELGFSYNCLGQYEKAIEVLKEAVALDPNNAYINKELLYAFIHNKQLEKAIDLYHKIIKEVPDKTYHAENAFNILGEYYRQKEVEKFTEWLNMTHVDKDERFGPYVEQLKKNLNSN